MPDSRSILSNSAEETFQLGETLGNELSGGEVMLLTGGLGAGKTLLAKGILSALKYDADEVTSPSFTLVNLYQTQLFNVYHIDLWRAEAEDAAFAVGLDEILAEENAVVIIEWAERLGKYEFNSIVYRVHIDGDGDDPRNIDIRREQIPARAI